MFDDVAVLIRGGGDLATGVALRLWRSGFRVALTELEQPLAIRRTVAFSEAVYDGETTVEGVTARRVTDPAGAGPAWRENVIPVIVDPNAESLSALRPPVMIDAILAKRNLGTQIHDASLVIGLGPGFTAGHDVHAVVETNRGHNLGRVLWSGSAQRDTGTPGEVNGIASRRVVYAGSEGVFVHRSVIGTLLSAGDVVGWVSERPVTAAIGGVLRGLIHDGVRVGARTKIADVDPRGIVEHCWTVSDKALAVAGGVLEAVLVHLRGRPPTDTA